MTATLPPKANPSKANPWLALVCVVGTLSLFAWMSDDLARKHGFFVLPFGALLAVVVGLGAAKIFSGIRMTK